MKADYISHMGSDLTVVNAARVSFDKESSYEYDPYSELWSLEAKDAKLIQYLAKHDHWTPFAHCQITLRETVPIFLARQRFKHTVGFVYNEVSRRYVDNEPEFYTPKVWRKKAENKKQGSSDEAVDLDYLMPEAYEDYIHEARALYITLLGAGVCPEQARMVLPQSMYTSYYVTGSLPAWSRAYLQRTQAGAQAEWNEVTEQWNKIISPLFPHSWGALVGAV